MAAEEMKREMDPLTRTMVELDHYLFRKMEGVRFHLHPTSHTPGMSVTMAKNEAFLSLNSVCKEFKIDKGSDDGIMLMRIGDALKYVKGLMVGDHLPKEVLTGEASWTITPKQILLAHQRIALKLVTMVNTDEPTTDDPEVLLKMADDPEIKRKINEAFEVAAVELGMQREQKQEVIDYVEKLAFELGHIEALREKYNEILKMRETIQRVRRLQTTSSRASESADQVARLMETARSEYAKIFEKIDSRTRDPMVMLRGLDDTVEMIRQTRDELYVRFSTWDDLLKRWGERMVEYSMRLDDLLADTHRFLAPRFMSFTDWTAMARDEQKRRSRLKIQPMDW